MSDFVRVERPTNRRRRVWWPYVVIAVVAVVFVWAMVHKTSELVVQNGVEYQILSFTSTSTDVDGNPVATYLVTFAYPASAEGTDLRRGTIHVPKAAVHFDASLPENGIIWDPEASVEGKTYGWVRWHPRHIEADTGKPAIVQEPPLTQP